MLGKSIKIYYNFARSKNYDQLPDGTLSWVQISNLFLIFNHIVTKVQSKYIYNLLYQE